MVSPRPIFRLFFSEQAPGFLQSLAAAFFTHVRGDHHLGRIFSGADITLFVFRAADSDQLLRQGTADFFVGDTDHFIFAGDF